MGRRSLAAKLAIAARTPGLEKDNVRKMVKAMQARYVTKEQAASVLSFDGSYEVGHKLEVWAGPMLFRYVEAVTYPANDPYGILCQSSEYDPFNYLLLADTEANSAAALRALYSRPDAYGYSEDWLIWAYDVQLGALVRFKASGYLSALRAAFPDQSTALVLKAAGIDLSSAGRPLLIMRAKDLGKLVTYEGNDV